MLLPVAVHVGGVEVMVDGAHAVAQIQFKISDLNCDYYGASLHKWLAVPLGVGILHVRKEKIAQIWPLLAEEGVPLTDIKHLNHVGTIPVYTDLAVDDAIDFYEKSGAKVLDDWRVVQMTEEGINTFLNNQ